MRNSEEVFGENFKNLIKNTWNFYLTDIITSLPTNPKYWGKICELKILKNSKYFTSAAALFSVLLSAKGIQEVKKIFNLWEWLSFERLSLSCVKVSEVSKPKNWLIILYCGIIFSVKRKEVFYSWKEQWVLSVINKLITEVTAIVIKRENFLSRQEVMLQKVWLGKVIT